jgi:Domain of unknown function (DUF4386)
MTRRRNARVAGIAFLVYIAAAMSGLFLSRGAAEGGTAAEKLASLAAHASALRLAIILELVGAFCALVLAVTLYAITRDEDADLALLAMVFRVAEGVVGGVSLQRSLGRLWLATGAGASDSGVTATLAPFLLTLPGTDLGATFFLGGSTIFAYLFVRGRIVPAVLAWLGLIGSLLALVVVPLGLVGLLGSPATDVVWIPLLVYEIWLAIWLIAKGAAVPRKAVSKPA